MSLRTVTLWLNYAITNFIAAINLTLWNALGGDYIGKFTSNFI